MVNDSVFIKENVIQFFKFGIVGLTNTFVSLTTYYLMLYFGIHYMIANIVGFTVGVLNSYFWNHKFVFKSIKFSLIEFLKTYLSYLSTFILNTVTLVLFIEFWNINQKVAPILNLTYSIPLNFILNKYWVYKNSRSK